MTIKYDGYFKEHYGSTLTEKDITDYNNWFEAQWRIITRHLKIGPQSRVLEIGAGFGGFYQFLQQAGVTDYTGLELDREAAAFANDYFDVDVFRVCPIESFKANQKYDFIFAFEVLEHVENPTGVLQHIQSLLRPGGAFCGTTPYPFARNVLGDNTHLSVLHPVNWHRLLKRAHFTDIQAYPMSFAPLLWRLHKRLNMRIPAYIPIKNFVATTLLIAKK